MNSPTMGAWECRHGVDGRDFCDRCMGPDSDHDCHANLTEQHSQVSVNGSFTVTVYCDFPVGDGEVCGSIAHRYNDSVL